MNIGHFKHPALPVSLIPGLKGKGILVIKRLVDIESTARDSHPAIIAWDIAIINCVIYIVVTCGSGFAAGVPLASRYQNTEHGRQFESHKSYCFQFCALMIKHEIYRCSLCQAILRYIHSLLFQLSFYKFDEK
jgi:hypothetical protein